MTRDLLKTLLFIAVAAGLAGAAAMTIPNRSKKDVDFNELNTKFFANFSDPNKTSSIEVIDVDTATAQMTPFKVQFKDNLWTVPSHYDYVVDGKDRLVKAATSLLDLTKDKIQSSRTDDHETLGVVDPLDTSARSIKGQGKRITLRDASDKILADLIIGKEVEGYPGQHYVREPGDKRTFVTNLKLELSTRFADWIETNLLKIDVAKVRKVEFSSHKINPAGPALIPGEVLQIERSDAGSPWKLTNAKVPEGKELNTEKLLALVDQLRDVKISGIRPKPESLSRDLMVKGDVNQPSTRTASMSLMSKGFYPLKDGRVLSNEGDIVVSCDDGAVYTLRFGEVFIGTGEALSAGKEEPKTKDAAKDATKKDEKKPDSTESRYLLVTTSFNPNMLPPLPDPDAGKLADLPTDVFHHEPGTPERKAQDDEVAKLAQAKLDKLKAEEDKRTGEAEKKVKALSERFARWYYLTPSDSFKSLALNREVLIRDKSAAPPPSGMPGGLPGGFPGGFPGGGGPPGAGRFNPHNIQN